MSQNITKREFLKKAIMAIVATIFTAGPLSYFATTKNTEGSAYSSGSYGA
jgi:hypothetical protein